MCNVALGIFSPFKFGLDTYLPDEHGVGYDIKKLKDHFRTLEVLINRDKPNYLLFLVELLII